MSASKTTILAPLILAGFVALVVADVALGLPFHYFIGGLAGLFLVAIAVGRSFDRVRNDRATVEALQPIRFLVTSGELVISGDFNFRTVKRLAVPDGEYVAALDLSSDHRQITRVRIAAPSDLEPAKFIVPVDYGLVYIADGRVAEQKELMAAVIELAGGPIIVPVASVISVSGWAFGIAVELGSGNGEYLFDLTVREIRAVYSGDDVE
jgi:hypothetical protein